MNLPPPPLISFQPSGLEIVKKNTLRRYAEFSAAIVGINETFPHEQMNRLLAILQVVILVFDTLSM